MRLRKKMGSNAARLFAEQFDARLAGIVIWAEGPDSENIKPNKAKSTEKIDGVVALIQALGSYMTEGNMNSVYDGRGLLIL